MGFNSLAFLIFFVSIIVLYWSCSRKSQNWLIFVGSYVFYGWWDWRFLTLIMFSTFVDYIAGLKIHHSPQIKTRKTWLILSVLTNLGLLGFFKYFNFFSDAFEEMISQMGWQVSTITLDIILPVGISFYTFQSLSYTIDIYRKQFEPTADFVSFAAFVSFFPQLVAGPIERAKNLLPQFLQDRRVSSEDIGDGFRQILWGYFKKLVIADNLAPLVDAGYNASNENGGLALIATYAFAFQIYADFSGYSDIARGCARLFGIRLMQNFRTPYFACSLSEFWRRWHISLSTWFRDYVYIPLGGNRCSKARHTSNLAATFAISGLWHGANFTYIFWGLYHGVLYGLSSLTHKRSKPVDLNEINWRPNFFKMLLVFHLVIFGWIFFRAQSIDHAFLILSQIGNYLKDPFYFNVENGLPLACLVSSLILIEFFTRHRLHALEIDHWPTPFRWSAEYLIFIVTLYFGQFQYQESFIYFQF